MPPALPAGPSLVRGDEPTSVLVALDLDAVADRIRREQPPLATAVRWILGVAADALLDAALAREPEDDETRWQDQRRKGQG